MTVVGRGLPIAALRGSSCVSRLHEAAPGHKASLAHVAKATLECRLRRFKPPLRTRLG